jgi:four helix bundle protein
MTIKTFEDVVAWQKGRELYVSLYKEFRGSKDFAYRDQLLRATLSITNNIAEGFDRGTDKELRYFLVIARGSAAEVRSMLWLAQGIGLLGDKELSEYLQDVEDISKLLTGFIKALDR